MPRQRSKNWSNDLDQAIISSWQMHEDLSPDLSTETLMELVRDDTGADIERQLKALNRAGLLKTNNNRP